MGSSPTVEITIFLSYVWLILHLVRPSSPPRDVQIIVESSTSINVSWKSSNLENRLRTTGYQVCIAHVQSEEECDVILRTKASKCVISGLKSASKYSVRVSGKNKVGYGKYGKDHITITNAGKFGKHVVYILDEQVNNF